MILELDCGNTRIKWRLLPGSGGEAQAHGSVATVRELERELAALGDPPLRWCRIVSVRSDEETRQVLTEITRERELHVLEARSASRCAGVRNGYHDFARLGRDRWLAIVGGYHLAGKACLVIDLGTAVTADFVRADGQHLGGFIGPGLLLMRAQLRSCTRGIRYGDDECAQAASALLPGRSTAEAVERGCLLMLRGFVREQYAVARELLGEDFDVFLTGGDAGLVADVCPQARIRTDLVFLGLGLACPIERG